MLPGKKRFFASSLDSGTDVPASPLLNSSSMSGIQNASVPTSISVSGGLSSDAVSKPAGESQQAAISAALDMRSKKRRLVEDSETSAAKTPVTATPSRSGLKALEVGEFEAVSNANLIAQALADQDDEEFSDGANMLGASTMSSSQHVQQQFGAEAQLGTPHFTAATPSPSILMASASSVSGMAPTPGASQEIAPPVFTAAPGEQLYCVCRRPYDEADDEMIACDGCDEWYHLACMGISSLRAKGTEKYLCFQCREQAGSTLEHRSESLECERTGCVRKARPHSRYCGDACGLQSHIQTLKQAAIEDARMRKKSERERDVMRKENYQKMLAQCRQQCVDLLRAFVFSLPETMAVPKSEAHKGLCLNSAVQKRNISRQLLDEGVVKRAIQALAPEHSTFAALSHNDRRAVHSDLEEVARLLVLLRAAEQEHVAVVERIKRVKAVIARGDSVSRDAVVEEKDDDALNTVKEMDCVSCGKPVSAKSYLSHLESCYAKVERVNMIVSRQGDPSAASIYCNVKDEKTGMYCMKIRATCTVHNNTHPSGPDTQVCGFPMQLLDVEKVNAVLDNESVRVCVTGKEKCTKHLNWRTLIHRRSILEKDTVDARIQFLRDSCLDIARRVAEVVLIDPEATMSVTTQ